MRIAVISNYDSVLYSELLQIVKIAKPEEYILDLSKYKSKNWKKDMEDRQLEIESSHQVVIGNDWQENLNARNDITFAMSKKKEIEIFIDGKFYPWDEYCARR